MAQYIEIPKLPSINDYDGNDLLLGDLPPLIWEMRLPPSIDADRIEVNLSAVIRLHRIGAIASSLVSDYQGEKTEYTPGVNGINADGTAVAAKSGVLKKAVKAQGSYLDRLIVPPLFPKEFGKPILHHKINRAELAQNVSAGVRDRGKSREAAWADELNTSLSQSMRKGAKEHLTGRSSTVRRNIDYGCYAFWASAVGIDMSSGSVPITSVAIWTAAQTLLTGMQSQSLKLMSGSRHLDQKRWSIFYGGHQTDRYIALNAISRASSLVRVRS